MVAAAGELRERVERMGEKEESRQVEKVGVGRSERTLSSLCHAPFPTHSSSGRASFMRE
jgi:hypothetical protein